MITLENTAFNNRNSILNTLNIPNYETLSNDTKRSIQIYGKETVCKKAILNTINKLKISHAISANIVLNESNIEIPINKKYYTNKENNQIVIKNNVINLNNAEEIKVYFSFNDYNNKSNDWYDILIKSEFGLIMLTFSPIL